MTQCKIGYFSYIERLAGIIWTGRRRLVPSGGSFPLSAARQMNPTKSLTLKSRVSWRIKTAGHLNAADIKIHRTSNSFRRYDRHTGSNIILSRCPRIGQRETAALPIN
ncbi:MAG: hypothetical protein VB106_02385 [Clostridiaceae bacterium]|nr:hypothetical protein [Clostridiaceae bacterium]